MHTPIAVSNGTLLCIDTHFKGMGIKFCGFVQGFRISFAYALDILQSDINSLWPSYHVASEILVNTGLVNGWLPADNTMPLSGPVLAYCQ